MSTTAERIVYVEFQDGRPFEIITIDGRGRQNHHDVEYCRRTGVLYHDLSGFGSRRGQHGTVAHRGVEFWAAPDFPVEIEEGATRREWAGPERDAWDAEFAGEYHPGPPWIEPSECVYCSICDDRLPAEDDHPCDHIHWCDEAEWWSTPSERCPVGCPDCIEDGYPTRAEGYPLALLAEGHALLYAPWREHWHSCHTRDRVAHGYGVAARRWFEIEKEDA